MNEIKNLLEIIRRMKTTVILILFVVFFLFYYKNLITEVVEKKVLKDEVKKDINNNVLIQQLLNDLMLRYNADRGYIFRFHNSIMYYDGHHKNHQSLAFEVCNKGISSEKLQLQNLPTSLFPVFLQEVMLNKMIYSDINDIKENSTRIALREQGIKSVMIAPVFKEGQFVAYIGLDYVKDSLNHNVNFREFKRQAAEIGNILTE